MSKSTTLFLQGTLIALVALFGASLVTTPAVGQGFPSTLTPLACAPGQQYLPAVTHGVADNFDPSGAVEPTFASVDSVAAVPWNTSSNNRYDDTVNSRYFADTFYLGLPANATAKAMRISGYLRPAAQGASWNTDTMYILQALPSSGNGFTPLYHPNFAIPLGTTSSVVWNIDGSGITSTPTLTAVSPLTMLANSPPTGQDVLNGITANGFIDIHIQNDTSVDYFAVELCYEPDPNATPDFEIIKSLNTCSVGSAPASAVCTYTLEIRNMGDPYSGELQVEEILNGHMQSINVIDAAGSNIPCQVFSGLGPSPLTFSSGTIIADTAAVCTVPNVFVDGTTPLFLTAMVEVDTQLFFGPGSDKLNCAAVVGWDGRPSGMTTVDFPSHCVLALTPTLHPQTPCELHIEASTPNSNLAVGDPIPVAFQITNEGGTACETVRMINYVAQADTAQSLATWLTLDPNALDQAATQPSHWNSPDDWVAYMQDPVGGNVPNFQFSFPATGLVFLGPDIPAGDLTGLHPSRRLQYSGPPVQNSTFQPGAQQDYDTNNLGPAADGGIVCGIAVVSISEYYDLRIALSLTSGLLKPPNLSSTTANEIWADNINNALAADGKFGVSCVGFNVQ